MGGVAGGRPATQDGFATRMRRFDSASHPSPPSTISATIDATATAGCRAAAAKREAESRNRNHTCYYPARVVSRVSRSVSCSQLPGKIYCHRRRRTAIVVRDDTMAVPTSKNRHARRNLEFRHFYIAGPQLKESTHNH